MRKPLSLFFVQLFTLTIIAQVNHWETAIYGTDTFQYFIGNREPPADWRSANFNDSSWLKGKGGLGYGEYNLNTIVPDSTLSIYIRKYFRVEDSSKIYAGLLTVDYDDGFAAWMNGIEVARANLGTIGDIPAYNTPASGYHEGLMHQGQIPSSYIIEHPVSKKLLKNGENVISVQVNNVIASSSDLTAILYLSFGIRDSSRLYDTIPEWIIPPKINEGSLLPLVIINTHEQEIPDGTKILADLGIINNGPGNFNFPDDKWNSYNAKAGIEIRGSSSTMFEKKNYNLETRDSLGVQQNVSLLGLPAENDWVLYGPYPDKSLIRNYLMYHLVNECGQWAPHTRLCELYINDLYKGVYYLVEKIKRDKNRVNIAKLETTDNQGITLTGGYIVKIDRSSTGDYSDGWFSPFLSSAGNSQIFFTFDYPKSADITSNQKDYIQDKITSFETLLKSANFADPLKGYRSIINVNSFIDHFIFTEMCRNVDGYRLSTFLHKNRDDKDPLIFMGPVWDYDLAFGNANYYDGFLTEGWGYLHPTKDEFDYFYTPFWWSRFMQDQGFVNSLQCRWQELRKGPLNPDSVDSIINDIVSKMGPAISRNFKQFPILGNWIWPNYYVGNTHADEINWLKNWISDRFSWLDANLPGECVISDISHEISMDCSIRAYPNPALGNINIEMQNSSGEAALIEVFNLYGQLSYSHAIKGQNYWIKNISLLPGSYFVRVNTNSGIKTTKFIIY